MRSVILSTLAAWTARILAIALNIAGLPLALEKLGASRFSLLLVILSVGSWIGFANIGMGRVVANIVARSARRSLRVVRHLISTALVAAVAFNTALFIAGLVLFLCAAKYLPAIDFLGESRSEFIVAILVLFFGMCVWFILSVFEGVDAGHQKLHRLYLFQIASYGASMLLLFLVFPKYPSITFAACLLTLSFLAGSIAHAFDVIRRNRILFSARPKLRRLTVRILVLDSFSFTLISLGIGIMFQLPTGLFGLVSGPESVMELGIFMRLMQSYGAIVIAFTFPLTSLIASRLHRGEHSSARQVVTGTGALLVIGAISGAILFALFANDVLALWLKTVRFSPAFVTAGAALIAVSALHFFLAAVLIAGANAKNVSWLHLIEAIGFIPIAYVLFAIEGQSGILIGLDAVLLAGCAWMIIRLLAHPVLGWLETPLALASERRGLRDPA